MFKGKSTGPIWGDLIIVQTLFSTSFYYYAHFAKTNFLGFHDLRICFCKVGRSDWIGDLLFVDLGQYLDLDLTETWVIADLSSR